MTLKERNIWHLPLLILAFWLGGCSMQYEDIEHPLVAEDNLNLVLSIHTGDRNTRSVVLEDGVDFEEAILSTEKMNTLRIIIVNKITGVITYNDYIPMSTAVVSVDGLKYKVDFDTTYTIYLIANEDGIPGSNTIFKNWNVGDVYAAGSLEALEIDSEKAGDPFINDENTPIPMTEIFDIVTVTKPKTLPSNNEVVQNETFFVTRAATKFSFYFFKADDVVESDDLEIKNIKIRGLGQKEYLFPFETVYSPTKETNRTAIERDIKAFTLPSIDNGVDEYDFELTTPFAIQDLPLKPEDFDINNPTAGTDEKDIRQFMPMIYFPESKGYSTGNPFECTISFDGDQYVAPVALPNLPHALPRNTHVVVVVTVHGRYVEATVDVIPFTSVEVAPDYGLEREEYTGYIVGGKDELGNQYWYDANYYEDQIDPEDPPVKYYLGPTGSEGQPVTINDKQYMLVYADIKDASGNTISGAQRSAANLHHFFEVFTEKDENEKVKSPKKHLLTPVAITGYEDRGAGVYINKWKQRVVLKDDLSFTTNTMYMDWSTSPPGEFQIYFEDYSLSYCRTLDEWDFVEFTYVSWDHKPGYYPKYWYDILGIQHRITIDGPSFPDFPSGDSVKISEWQKEVKEVWNPAFIKWIEDVNKEKAKILGDWVKYLQ